MAMLEEVKRGGMKSCLLVQGDMRALPFRDNAFEGVLCIRILHRVPESLERRELLEEVIRVSRRWVVTSFYDSNTPHAARKKERGRYDGITREVFRSEVESLGWGVTQYWGMRRFWRAHSQTLALLEVLKADEGVRSSD
jgi:ubiquinone/menaquinone biosynthesis C-methylase UbiE